MGKVVGYCGGTVHCQITLLPKFAPRKCPVIVKDIYCNRRNVHGVNILAYFGQVFRCTKCQLGLDAQEFTSAEISTFTVLNLF